MSFPRLSLSPFVRLSLAAGMAVGFAACAQQPAQPPVPVAQPAATQAQGRQAEVSKGDAAAAEPAGAPAAAAKPELPKQDLTEATLYEYLLAEIAGQRGALGLSAQAYADLAKRTRDPRIAKRAAEVAVYARMPSAAIDAAKIWYETEPTSLQALQVLTSLLVGAKRETEALPYLRKLLEADASGDAFLQLPRLLANNQDKALTLKLVQQLAQPYPNAARRLSASAFDCCCSSCASNSTGSSQSGLSAAAARASASASSPWPAPDAA